MEKQEKTLKVGYVAPMSISAVNGGVRTQALNTIRHIENYNIEPVLLSPWISFESVKPDLIHIFNASPENAGIMKVLKGLNIPIVISPVFYSNRKSSVIKAAIQMEKGLSVLGSGIHSDFNIKAEICREANMLLPNTSEEARLIEHGFSIDKQKIKVIPNGVETHFSDANPDLFYSTYGIKDFVLFAGQAGAPRKNVISLLRIAPKLNTPLVIIGSFYDDEYGRECRRLAEKYNVHLIETLDHTSELLASAYAACKVFVLPSQYETPGIAALEAALSGAQIAITKKGGTKDYFEDFAEYLDPDDEASVLEAILKAIQKGKDAALKQHILENYTWDIVARKTAAAYKSLVG